MVGVWAPQHLHHCLLPHLPFAYLLPVLLQTIRAMWTVTDKPPFSMRLALSTWPLESMTWASLHRGCFLSFVRSKCTFVCFFPLSLSDTAKPASHSTRLVCFESMSFFCSSFFSPLLLVKRGKNWMIERVLSIYLSTCPSSPSVESPDVGEM